jgi:hypothetical protein
MDGISQPSSMKWGNSGIGTRGECLTANISESHSDADGYGLSDIIETFAVPPQYYLSPKAAAGILRRARRRGKELPPELLEALTDVIANGE